MPPGFRLHGVPCVHCGLPADFLELAPCGLQVVHARRGRYARCAIRFPCPLPGSGEAAAAAESYRSTTVRMIGGR